MAGQEQSARNRELMNCRWPRVDFSTDMYTVASYLRDEHFSSDERFVGLPPMTHEARMTNRHGGIRALASVYL